MEALRTTSSLSNLFLKNFSNNAFSSSVKVTVWRRKNKEICVWVRDFEWVSVTINGCHLMGVCYSMAGGNLPSPQDVINLYKQNQIEMMRLYEPSLPMLEALRGSGITVSLGIMNQDLATLSSSQEQANAWVLTNVVPYYKDVVIYWISVGNEVIPGPEAQFVPGAINNIYNALLQYGLGDIKVTTVLANTALGNSSFPPSAGAFTPEVMDVMNQIMPFLRLHQSTLMVNIYPYFAYANNPKEISLDYALFKSTTPVVVDGEFKYYNLYHTMLDAFNAALEKINMSDVFLTVSETGWPSAGNDHPYSSIENAQTYNNNLIKHYVQGTPRRPTHSHNTFLFSMFNEDLKQPAGSVEQNFGLYYPNMQPVYPIDWPKYLTDDHLIS